MRSVSRVALSLTVAAASLLCQSPDAAASGGVFPESASAPVVRHRMLLAIGKSKTTLWDQVHYTGDPKSFAWVLPVKGTADVSVSSDAIFQVLEGKPTGVHVIPRNYCDLVLEQIYDPYTNDDIKIVDTKLVGPYETTQLAAQDPQTLTDWLTSRNYSIPAEIEPVIGDYISEGYGFIAIKLAPGMGVEAMRPVRVTTAGVQPVVPLRLAAAGAGQTTAMDLWVLASADYRIKNRPWFLLGFDDLVWDWSTYTSNFDELLSQKLAETGGFAWAVAHLGSPSGLRGPFDKGEKRGVAYLEQVLTEQAEPSYADENGMNAAANLAEELALLAVTKDPDDLRLHHFYAELPKEGFAVDLELELQPAESYSRVAPLHYTASEVGINPCNASGGGGPGGGGPGGSGTGGTGGTGDDSDDNDGCSLAAPGEPAPSGIFLMGLGAVVAGVMQRRGRRASARHL